MKNRTLGFGPSIAEKLKNNKIKNDKKAAKRQETNPVKELHREWISSMRGEFELKTVPSWAGVDYSLSKKLVNEFGYDKAVDLIRYFIETWTKRRTGFQERRGELPCVKLCWSLRTRLLAEMEGVVKCPMSKRERVMRGEYNQSSADVSPLRGWD